MKCFFVTIRPAAHVSYCKLHAYSKELMANMQLQYCMNCDINTHYLHPFLPHYAKESSGFWLIVKTSLHADLII